MPRLAKRYPLSLVVFLAALIVGTARADVSLPAVVGSNMVLQRDKPLPVWGWAEVGEKVTVSVGQNAATAVTKEDGKWMVKLKAMEAGGPHQMVVKGTNTITLENILVGEVWLCSGQSNMEWSVLAALAPQEEVAAAKYPSIRLFHVPKVPSPRPARDVQATWNVCSPETIGRFSAVGYFYGRCLHKELGIPIGLINSSWGGTRIEPWTPPVGFAAVPALGEFLKQEANAGVEGYKAALDAFLLAVEKKMKDHLEPPRKKEDDEDDLDDEEADDDGGMVLNMPVPEDPQLKNAQRIRKWLPGARKAALADKPLPQISGGWPRGWPPAPSDPRRSHGMSSALFNGMISPLVPFAIRGAIWYQGESNRGRGMMYHEMMKGLIYGWRKIWGTDDLPFYFVQLAPYRYGGDPVLLPEMWEAQTATLSVPKTGMAVITDIGNVGNIHPKNKQEVGRRLSLWALAKTYGKTDLVYSGPLYKSMKVEGNRIRLHFDHVGGGLTTSNRNPLSHFTIAGEDRRFVPAKADVDGDTIVVSAEGVAQPVAVRFGWHQEAEPNFVNEEQLPASPFRTDKWPREEEKPAEAGN